MSTLWCLMLDLPLATVSLANARGHWGGKAKTVATQRGAAHLALKTQGRVFLERLVGMLGPRAHLGIGLVREYASPRRAYDDDNLRGALKAVRDGVADALALSGAVPGFAPNKRRRGNDSHPLLEWHYGQRKAPRDAVVVWLEVVQGARGVSRDVLDVVDACREVQRDA